MLKDPKNAVGLAQCERRRGDAKGIKVRAEEGFLFLLIIRKPNCLRGERHAKKIIAPGGQVTALIVGP